MDMMLKIVYMADTILIYYQVPTFCLLGVAAYRGWKNGAKVMLRSAIAFCISIAILIGMPMGIIESLLPEETSGDVETVIMKEVSEWTN